MKLFPQDNGVVLYETGFEDDILERKFISKQLSELVERIEDPVVLALDDQWGSGKTFFLKRWVAAHTTENDGSATTIYFDAFENDYLTDPLISIIAAVSARLSPEQAATIEKWKLAAAKLAKPALGIALSVATFGAKQHLNEIGDVITDSIGGEVKDAAQKLWDAEKDRKEAMNDFRILLSELSQKSDGPIIVVIDELDRCRPDYALSILEVIKHFFSVQKVHFILGVNGKALENSVKARYGADIDAERYLRKFINVSFTLPRTTGGRSETNVIEKFATKLIFDMELPPKVSNRCVDLLKWVANSREVSLRDVGKVLSKVALVPTEVHQNQHLDGHVDILCALIVTSVVDPQLHTKLVSGDVQTAELREYLSATSESTIEFIDEKRNSAYNHDITILLTTILFCCGKEELKNVSNLPSWIEEIGNRFGRNVSQDRKSIAPKIQKDWIELFKI